MKFLTYLNNFWWMVVDTNMLWYLFRDLVITLWLHTPNKYSVYVHQTIYRRILIVALQPNIRNNPKCPLRMDKIFFTLTLAVSGILYNNEKDELLLHAAWISQALHFLKQARTNQIMQNQFMVMEVREMGTLGVVLTGRGHKGYLWSAGDRLHLNLGGSYLV